FLAESAVRVFEQREAGDTPESADEDLVRAGIPADVVRIPGSVREIGEAGLPGEEAVRDARAGRARDDAAAADGVPLLRLGLMVGARLRRLPEQELALAVEDDEDLLLRRMRVRRRALLPRLERAPV